MGCGSGELSSNTHSLKATFTERIECEGMVGTVPSITIKLGATVTTYYHGAVWH